MPTAARCTTGNMPGYDDAVRLASCGPLLGGAESAHELLAGRSTAIGQVKEKMKTFENLFGMLKG